MADVPVVVSDAGDGTPAVGQLFKDVSFFLSLRLPTRSRFVAVVKANGGRVVQMEKHADFVIADHMRKPTPAGSFSYTLIEQAVRDGVFPNPADHALGPLADSPRAAGSSVPGKRTRTAFTAEDDKTLWQWAELAKAQGHLIKGNDIYKRLEATNPRHTWQAWRDRYVRKLIDRPPPGAQIDTGASPGQSSADDSEEDVLAATPQGRTQSKERRQKPSTDVGADANDWDLLWAQAKDIDNMDEAMYEDAWDLWAQEYQKFSAVEWRHFWESEVRPAYHKQRAKAKAKRRHTLASDDENGTSAGATSRKKGKKRHVAPDKGDAESSLPRRASPAIEVAMAATGAEVAQMDVDDDLEAPDEDLMALETWRDLAERKPSSGYRPDISDLPTSEIDRAVDQQLRAETEGTTLKHPVNPSEQILTSEMNCAADTQIQKEADGPLLEQLRPIEVMNQQFNTSKASQAAAAQPNPQPFKAAADGHTRHGHGRSNDGEFSSRDYLRAWYAEQVAELEANVGRTESCSNALPPETLSQALTEANLASQQAQHAEQLTRGVDLPEDDQNKDQSEYVNFLQNITGQPHDGDADIEDMHGTQPASNIPMSSKREVDNAMENTFDWPSSPQQRREQPESQEQEFETQSFISQAKDKTHLNQGQYAVTTEMLPATHRRSNGAREVARDENSEMAQPDIFEGLDEINDPQIDLSLPEPEGDFTSTSSPARVRTVTGQTSILNRKLGKIPESAVDDLENTNKNVQKVAPSRIDVVDISSGASSSSSFSAHAAEAPTEPFKTLPAMRRHALDTQDIMNAEIQLPDFSVPLPDDEQDCEEGLASTISVPHAQQAQEFVAAATQASDFSVPLPADGNGEVEAEARVPGSNPAGQPRQKQNVVNSQTMDVERELESWLDTQHVRGFNEASSIAAMQRSSMRPELAELVLLAEKVGLDLPNDVPGIWSEQEDRILESGDSGALRRLEAKHGWDECDARMRFLAEWREA